MYVLVCVLFYSLSFFFLCKLLLATVNRDIGTVMRSGGDGCNSEEYVPDPVNRRSSSKGE